MEHLWEQKNDSPVVLRSYKDICNYLDRKVKTFNGMRVRRFKCGRELSVWVSVWHPYVRQSHILFFGYITDVARNIQNSVYEAKADW